VEKLIEELKLRKYTFARSRSRYKIYSAITEHKSLRTTHIYTHVTIAEGKIISTYLNH